MKLTKKACAAAAIDAIDLALGFLSITIRCIFINSPRPPLPQRLCTCKKKPKKPAEPAKPARRSARRSAVRQKSTSSPVATSAPPQGTKAPEHKVMTTPLLSLSPSTTCSSLRPPSVYPDASLPYEYRNHTSPSQYKYKVLSISRIILRKKSIDLTSGNGGNDQVITMEPENPVTSIDDLSYNEMVYVFNMRRIEGRSNIRPLSELMPDVLPAIEATRAKLNEAERVNGTGMEWRFAELFYCILEDGQLGVFLVQREVTGPRGLSDDMIQAIESKKKKKSKFIQAILKPFTKSPGKPKKKKKQRVPMTEEEREAFNMMLLSVL
ncbi:hypothetical protein H072_3184 [Dactylellina haptotyla CBS 200.50]|uniref:Uncharacterized protein n=1 Tax=Dactylellina haptotyla (strain CBS 200.50) TaxID=1284197 RepID=S8C528_DACHA|nr:hypothetical protein H072_3184 [Dactylellina haptotyla CBS 200.50]